MNAGNAIRGLFFSSTLTVRVELKKEAFHWSKKGVEMRSSNGKKKKEAECYFYFDHSYFSVEITFFSTLASLFTLSKNCEHVKFMFILQETKALTVLSDMLLRS